MLNVNYKTNIIIIVAVDITIVLWSGKDNMK